MELNNINSELVCLGKFDSGEDIFSRIQCLGAKCVVLLSSLVIVDETFDDAKK